MVITRLINKVCVNGPCQFSVYIQLKEKVKEKKEKKFQFVYFAGCIGVIFKLSCLPKRSWAFMFEFL